VTTFLYHSKRLKRQELLASRRFLAVKLGADQGKTIFRAQREKLAFGIAGITIFARKRKNFMKASSAASQIRATPNRKPAGAGFWY
jgi:hypothetical protein